MTSLILVQNRIRKKTKDLLNDYEVPPIFRDDLFEILDRNSKRPPYRWIVIGPARSGTNIHIDPLGTSAWNSLIYGHKRWVLIHPDTPKELVRIPKSAQGVHPKESITWFMTVYKRICDGDWPFDKYPVLELRQNPGETLFVPCGWWHVVINEDITIAITQNFCSSINLIRVYPTICEERPGLSHVFLKKLNENRPDLLETVYKSLLDSKPILDGYSSSSCDGGETNECELTSSSSISVPDSTELSNYSSSSDEEERYSNDACSSNVTNSAVVEDGSEELNRKEVRHVLEASGDRSILEKIDSSENSTSYNDLANDEYTATDTSRSDELMKLSRYVTQKIDQDCFFTHHSLEDF
ncbi:JmjC domain protein [Dictyocaulus viviparus]|uniref:JmjC domain protein n=1 Tax=Dictyocaulus viviparus TaxID=29172 RepID=A0A0D8XQY5_DICVI|nr:JmjC domain protein [Dictyocaulus viviparus]